VQQYQSFTFDAYEFDPATGRIELRYSLDDDVHFTETLQLPDGCKAIASKRSLAPALQMLHLLGGVSYFKTCCPEKILVKSGDLSKEQAKFFQSVYENGLGEFAYKNKVNLWGKISFPAMKKIGSAAQTSPLKKLSTGKRANEQTSKLLVPLGGGKDSIVTIEKLRTEGKDLTLLRMGTHPLIDALVGAMQLPCITVERTLAPELMKLNAEGAMNGHVPITAYLSALAVVVAEIYGFDAVVMSNEQSASEGNVEHFGKPINHQWSKGAEAEQMIRSYIHDNIDPNLRYENLLRDMTELQIVKDFVRYPQYFELFTSCNRNWKLINEQRATSNSRWCTSCPKCAFLFLMLAAHLPKRDVLRIFEGNLFENEALLPLFRQLLGIEGFKPFECVGTPEESREALAMIRNRGDFNDTIVFKSLSDAS